ncbi:MAG: hypothetical protein ABI144_04710 [Gallionella sp.]
MAKKVAIVLAFAMLAVVAWGLFFEVGSTRIIINGRELVGPFSGAVGAAGSIIGLTALFCAAIFLLFVFAGIGVFILGGMIVAGLVMTGFAFPFLLVLLLPLALVWLFIAIIRKAGT